MNARFLACGDLSAGGNEFQRRFRCPAFVCMGNRLAKTAKPSDNSRVTATNLSLNVALPDPDLQSARAVLWAARCFRLTAPGGRGRWALRALRLQEVVLNGKQNRARDI
jgi:hypothetical protein